MDESRYQYDGSCRCGALEIRYYCSQPRQALVPRACGCVFCLPRRASYLSDPAGRLDVMPKDRRLLYAHVFGTGTADFMHCARCNQLVYVRSEIAGRQYGLVLSQALSDPPPAPPQAVDYAAETLQERLARRAAQWIPDVAVIEHA